VERREEKEMSDEDETFMKQSTMILTWEKKSRDLRELAKHSQDESMKLTLRVKAKTLEECANQLKETL
jgi:hypothetical protein